MSNNTNNNGEMMGIALVIAVMWLAMLFVYAFAVFAAFLLTGFALYAWNEPRRMFGGVFTPEEARAFVGRGILGAIGLPAFALFCVAMFGIRIEEQYWMHIVLGGYAFGSLGLAIMEADAPTKPDGFDGLTIEGTPNQPSPPAATPPAAPTSGPWSREPTPPFRFASWDDEEELKR